MSSSEGSPPSTGWQQKQLNVKSGKILRIWIWCCERWGSAPWCLGPSLRILLQPSNSKRQACWSCYLQVLDCKRQASFWSEIEDVSSRKVCWSTLIPNMLRLPGKGLFQQPDRLQGAHSENQCFGSSFEDSCMVGSQQGGPSRTLEAEDDKLCHWKKKKPVTGVDLS